MEEAKKDKDRNKKKKKIGEKRRKEVDQEGKRI